MRLFLAHPPEQFSICQCPSYNLGFETRHTLSGEIWPHRPKRDQPQLYAAPPAPTPLAALVHLLWRAVEASCRRWLEQAQENWSLNLQEFCEVVFKPFIAWNPPWWQYLHHRYGQIQQIRASLPHPLESWFTSISLSLTNHIQRLLGFSDSQRIGRNL